MANGFGSLYVGQSGLQSAQYALNTTANNLANVDTTGYVREQVRFQDRNYLQVKDTKIGVNGQQSGLGVSIADVVHARDTFLDQAYRTENGRQNFYETCYDATDQIIDLLQELDGEEFKNSMTQFYEAIVELSKRPEDTTDQSLLVQKADLFIARCQSLYTDLQNYQSNINDEIKDDVERINEIGQEIYKLNLAVQKVEMGGVETAMEIRDRRDKLIDELSSYGSVDITEDITGFVYVDFENQRFVDDNRAYEIGLRADSGTGFVTPYWTQESDPVRNEYTYVFRTDVDIDPDYGNDIGQTKAKLLARGSGYELYKDSVGRLIIMENGYGQRADTDALGWTLVSQGSGYGRYTDIDALIDKEFQYSRILGGRAIMETQAELDKLFHTMVTQINDLLCPNKECTSGGTGTVIRLVNSNGSPAYDADGNPMTYTVTAGDSVLGGRTSVKVLDVDNCSYGSDGELAPYELFSRTSVDRYTKVEVPAEGSGYFVYVYNEENSTDVSSLYTLGNVGVNPVLVKDYTKIPTYTDNPNLFKEQGSDVPAVDYSTMQKIVKIWGEFSEDLYITPNDSYPCMFTEFYDKVVSKLATEANVYGSKAQSSEDAAAATDNKRLQVTGVSSDEELTKMIKFQAAYNAASRFMTVISQMTELVVTGLK